MIIYRSTSLRKKIGIFLKKKKPTQISLPSTPSISTSWWLLLTSVSWWVKATVPSFFGTSDWFCGRQYFYGWGRGVGMMQVYYIYCALHYYYLSALLPGIRSKRLGTPELKSFLFLHVLYLRWRSKSNAYSSMSKTPSPQRVYNILLMRNAT